MEGPRPGRSLDLSTGWNFSRREDREAARRLLKEDDPQLLILSPPCTFWSVLRQLSDHKRPLETLRCEEIEAEGEKEKVSLPSIS